MVTQQFIMSNYGRRDHHQRSYQQGDSRRFQRSFVGQKRDRQEEVYDPKKELLQELVGLGDPSASHDVPQYIKGLARSFERQRQQQGDWLDSIVLECVVNLAAKTPYLATLVAVLHTDNPQWSGDIVDRLARSLSDALASCNPLATKLLLRFCAALVPVNVVRSTSVAALLLRCAQTALQLTATNADVSGRSWQPYSDHLVLSALLAVPWAAGELFESAASDMEGFMEAVQRYIEARPRQSDDELRPFYGSLSDQVSAFWTTEQ